MVQHPVDAETGDEDSGKERGENTNAEGDCETLDRTRTEKHQDETQQEGGHLTVDDSGISILETGINSIGQTGTSTELFLDTFIDNNVTINSHSQGQHNTGNTGHGENSTHRGKHTHQKEDVSDKGNNRNPTTAVVEDNHVDENDDESQDEGDKSFVNRFLTQRRTNNGFLDDNGRSRQFT